VTEADGPLAASTLPPEAPTAGEPTPVPTPAPGPDVARRGSARRWLIIGAIAVVFLLIIGYVIGGAAAAGGPVGRADTALHTVVSHNNEMANSFKGDPFQGIDFKSDNPDIPAAKTAVANEKQKLSKWQALISSDRTALQQVRPDLNSSFLTLPEQGTLDRDRQRVEAALSAMTSAQKAVDLYSKELAFMDPFLDAVAGFVAIGKAGTAQDIAGIKAQLPGTGASIQKAIDLSQPPAIPAELSPTLKAIQQVLSDIQALVTAVEANDAAAIQKYATAVEAEGSNLSTYDSTSLEAAIKALYQPLSDAYDRDMKIAAGN
jgi:hypothetical protein